MSCPEIVWDRALAHRFDPQASEPADWPTLESHLETCADCRRRAVAVDPSLLFSLRPPEPPASQAGPRNEAAAMIEAVATMRRTARVERHAEENRTWARRLGHARWTRWVAAAAVAVAALSYGALGMGGLSADDPAGGAVRVEAPAPSPHLPEILQRVEAARSVPVFEGLNRPEARVYEWMSEDSDVAVLMIVDENLDV